MLVERIEEIDREVEGMFKGWRSVEEGGRSLQEACQRLLEERVSSRLCRLDLCVEGLCVRGVGPVGRAAGRYRTETGLFPGIGARDEDAQPSGRLACPSDGLLVYGRTRRCLY